MSYFVDDTIVAVASAPGEAMRGIVRCSGPDVLAILSQCFRPHAGEELTQKQSRVIAGEFSVCEPIGRVSTDLYLWPTTRSYTQQPCVEIHTIGSPPVLAAIVRSICEFGARLAEPGEFTMRAFLAGRLDLTQAEAVLGVIDAESQSELDVALTQLAGGLRNPLDQLRNQMLDLLAHLEAGLDFVEEDIEFISSTDLQNSLRRANDQLSSITDQMNDRTEAVDEYRVVLVGAPNAGKSSLLNALAGTPEAIVSPVAGTTRDYVSCELAIDGLRFVVIDTAGVAEITDANNVDSAAQSMSHSQAKIAHLQLFCLDVSQPATSWENDEIARPNSKRIVVGTKCDLASGESLLQTDVQTSSRSNVGVDDLKKKIVEFLKEQQVASSTVSVTANRCRDSLRLAAAAIDRAIELSELDAGEELVAAELRGALDELGRVVGTIYTDDILDRVFSQFCIGK